jgi:hypothetical protein
MGPVTRPTSTGPKPCGSVAATIPVADEEGDVLATRDKVDEAYELEALWNASPAEVDETAHLRRPRRSTLDLAARIPGVALIWGWIALFAGSVVFAPVPDSHAATPAWANLLAVSFVFALLGAPIVGRRLPAAGFGLATAAGALGVGLAVACTATGHHAGSWWLAELGGTGALTALAGAGLAGRLGRR